MDAPTKTALYRMFGADGVLLYVGISLSPYSRWKNHAGEKDWIEQVATMTVEWHDTREDALYFERCAIVDEGPLHNIQHSTGPKPVADGPRGGRRLHCICTGCGTVIRDGDGWIELDRASASDAARVLRALTATDVLDASQLVAVPTISWLAWHRTCDPDIESNAYWFAVERLKSSADLFHVSQHLSTKSWIDVTDWWWQVDARSDREVGIFYEGVA